MQSGIFNQYSNFNLKIFYLLFNYSIPTIRIIRIVFGSQKMNEYEYRIPLFGPHYSNSRIIRIIRDNTDPNTDLAEKKRSMFCPIKLWTITLNQLHSLQRLVKCSKVFLEAFIGSKLKQDKKIGKYLKHLYYYCEKSMQEEGVVLPLHRRNRY